MGTRNLTVVIQNAEPRVAQYGQWDGYPAGSGLGVKEFLSNEENINLLKRALKKVRWFNEKDQEEMDTFLESIGSVDGWMNMEQSEKFNEKYPLLTRDHGYRILHLLITSTLDEIVLRDQYEFGADGLFCEWAYVIDLDNNNLEVYGGFQIGKVEGRFADMKSETEYSPVGLIKTYSFKELRSMTDDQFVAEFEEHEEEI